MDKSHKTIIGKDVIESLTLGMYEDSKFIYREYIQNSADQIDKAISLGILETREDGNIWIEINEDQRKVIIEDNATGIKANEVADILRNIAQSTKKRGIDKGFRGIGRLGGLGYCDLLTFETSFKGENIKSTMIWDAKELKRIINNREQKEEASEVIDHVTDFNTANEEPDKHYFKVTLEKVNNKALLDNQKVRDYLTMVAPVPFPNGFIFRTKIYEYLKSNSFKIDEYNIYLNTDQIYKAYTTTIYEGENRTNDEIFDLRFFNFNEQAGEFLVWGWYGISSFIKQIPQNGNLARGIRIRSCNIQIGDENSLVKLHKEQRGNFYFFGEVHALHRDLIPNARRDYFIENKTTALFEAKLKEFFHTELYNLYYFSSKVRSEQRKIKKFEELKQEYETKTKNIGFKDKEEAKQYEEKLVDYKNKAEKAQETLKKVDSELSNESTPKKRIFDKVINSNKTETPVIEIPKYQEKNKIKYVFDDLTAVTKEERKLISRVFSVVDKCLSDKKIVENIRIKIIEEFK